MVLRQQKKIINYIYTNEFTKGLKNNKFSFCYNAPGFEMPYILYSFSDILNLDESTVIVQSEDYLNKQLLQTFNFSTNKFDKNTTDPNTLTARIYELCRLPNNFFEKIKINIYE